MITHLIKKTSNYFLHFDGRVTKIENGREVDVPIKSSKKTKRLFVIINGITHDYLTLMLQYFKPEFKPNDKLKYKISKDNRIHSNSIVIKPFISSVLSNEDEKLHHLFMCERKANAANYRCVEKITSYQVFYTLKIHNFKCIYCLGDIHPANWHLDHYTPLAKNGKNKFENIVPSCPTCNLMKGALTGEQFYMRCKKVTSNFMFSKQFENNNNN